MSVTKIAFFLAISLLFLHNLCADIVEESQFLYIFIIVFSLSYRESLGEIFLNRFLFFLNFGWWEEGGRGKVHDFFCFLLCKILNPQ
jgi:hypothetical protein